MNYYETEKVNDNLTMIRSLTGELLYLVEGEADAILIDTCLGVGYLKALVSSLTDKNLKVLLTHGHVDHAMGAPEFEGVYMNPRDIPIYRSHCPLEMRRDYIRSNIGEKAEQELVNSYVQPEPDYLFQDLVDGMIFDLGGIHIEAYSYPGHTPGSMVFLIREMRILILGDACNTFTFLFDENSSPVDEYMRTTERMRDRLKGKYDRVFLSHREMETGKDIMDDIIEVCREILDGKTDDIPFDFMGTKAYIAKLCDEQVKRVDGKCGNIVYNKERLY